MRAAQDRNADRVNVILKRRRRDHLWRLPQARINNFHPGVPERTRNHLGPSVMTIKPRLGNKNAYLLFRHKKAVTSEK
jgi:hypothetical protein